MRLSSPPMRRPFVVVLLALAACPSRSAPPADPHEIPNRAPDVPCFPELAELVDGVALPTVLGELLGPDRVVGAWSVTVRASDGSRELRWTVSSASEPSWLDNEAATALEIATGVPPLVEDGVLTSSWQDDWTTHTLAVQGAPGGHEVDYRCAVTGITPIRLYDVDVMSEHLDIDRIPIALRSQLVDRPIVRAWVVGEGPARTYGWEVIAPADEIVADGVAVTPVPDADRAIVEYPVP